jgi:chemotaxis protein MotB
MARKKPEEEHENHERWLVSYADMITLLMVFFIILYASSQLNVSKYMAFQNSFSHALGASVTEPPKPKESPGQSKVEQPKEPTDVNNPKATPSPSAPPVNNNIPADSGAGAIDLKALEELYQKVKKEIKDKGLDKDVEVTEDQRGVILVFTDRVLFDSAKAQITTAGSTILKKVAPVLKDQPMPIIVEGHSDNRPIASAKYPTNWELSTARSTNVLRDLVDLLGLSPNRMSAAGYADTHPRVRNDTDAHRAMNRRVEIVIVAPKAASRAGVALPNPTATATPSATPTEH